MDSHSTISFAFAPRAEGHHCFGVESTLRTHFLGKVERRSTTQLNFAGEHRNIRANLDMKCQSVIDELIALVAGGALVLVVDITWRVCRQNGRSFIHKATKERQRP